MAVFYLPTRIVTGEGSVAELTQYTPHYGRRATLVCGTRSLRASGRLERALRDLRSAQVDVSVYDGVSGEPTLDMVQEGLNLARAARADVVIGIGGGSAMDVAKAVAGLCPHPGTVHEYFQEKRQIPGKGLPWIAVPTVAGTGAEVTKNAVLISPQDHRKDSLRHDSWFASVALIDPELTLSVPPDVTAAGGSDALTQAIESYTSIGAMPLTDALASDAIARIGRSLERACADGQDIQARADLLYGSMLAGCALANARLGGVHGMAHPLGAHFQIPHGIICGLLLPYVMAHNLDHVVEKYARVGQLLGETTPDMDMRMAAQHAVERIKQLFQAIGVPSHLGRYGVQHEDLAVIAQESLPSSSLKHNPRPLGAQDVEDILAAAL